jgi:hypothetical protein
MFLKTLKFLANLIAAIICIVLQQGLIIGIGLLVSAQTSVFWGRAIWILCIPMVYMNIKTYKNIMKYGLINFMTVNADTSEIDVPKDKRLY